MAFGFTTSSHAAAHSTRPEALEAPFDRHVPRASLVVSVAQTQSELEAATALLEALYSSRGYRPARLGASLATERVLVAAVSGEIVGTLTLRLDSASGLRADETYRAELDAARARGRGVAELGRFAVASNRRSMSVIGALFGRAYGLLRESARTTDVFIEVNPRHVPFYRNAFGFRVTGDERTCPRVLAPSVLLRLDLAEFEARLCEPDGRARWWRSASALI